MSKETQNNRSRAQESTNAIERMYITMRHLLNRGFYKPSGVSGNALRTALLLLRPEIYGTVAEDKAELESLRHRHQLRQQWPGADQRPRRCESQATHGRHRAGSRAARQVHGVQSAPSRRPAE